MPENANPKVCPKCGAVMKTASFRTSLPSQPKRIEVHCPKCGTHRPLEPDTIRAAPETTIDDSDLSDEDTVRIRPPKTN